VKTRRGLDARPLADASAPALHIDAILKRLPHRYPFLLVDRVLEYQLDKRIRALKNVTCNEPFFGGHFPERPVMPGVMIIEALAQTAGILCFLSANVIPDEQTRFYFVGIDQARFRKPVEPGDQLLLTARIERVLKGVPRFATAAFVGEVEVAHAQMMMTLETARNLTRAR
jgi:3-hydroxyacyl-[acyl-carrier-protein] dehydratase